jgi:hypothetical protein
MSYDELGHRWPQPDGAQLVWDFVSRFTLDLEDADEAG